MNDIVPNLAFLLNTFQGEQPCRAGVGVADFLHALIVSREVGIEVFREEDGLGSDVLHFVRTAELWRFDQTP